MSLVKVRTQDKTMWLNLDHVMWVEEDPMTKNYKICFEKSTIIVIPPADAGSLLEALNPPPMGFNPPGFNCGEVDDRHHAETKKPKKSKP